MAKEVAFGAEEAASVVDCSAEANEEGVQGLARFNRKPNTEFADQMETLIAQLRGMGGAARTGAVKPPENGRPVDRRAENNPNSGETADSWIDEYVAGTPIPQVFRSMNGSTIHVGNIFRHF